MKIPFGIGEIVFLPDSLGFNMPATNGLSSPRKTLEVAYGGAAYPFQKSQLPSLSSPNPFIEQGPDTYFFCISNDFNLYGVRIPILRVQHKNWSCNGKTPRPGTNKCGTMLWQHFLKQD